MSYKISCEETVGSDFDVLLTVRLRINQLNAQNLVL